ncbi:MAG TPA: replicative DNA helicase [Bacteroidales bacterium]|nr:replicative DNA helicase [Bacteroidales bacterium]HRR49339.1 replicative DNA helicase [Bacteroidales bacterium]HRT83772.1 replicative DNA helicase [Bacteroidales bacterium]
MAKTYKKKENPDKEVDLISIEMGKKPPQAVDIEEAVLGALMLEPEAVADVVDTLVPECFYKESNRKIFSAIISLATRHAPVDIFTVSEELNKTGDLDIVGGTVYLTQLSMKIGAAAHIDYHSKILLQKYIQRELISISYQIQRDSFDDTIPVDDLLDSTQQKIFTLSDRNMKKDTQSIQYVISEAIEELQNNQIKANGLSGIPSGYTSIDRVTLGWQPSDLIIIAARPSMGKTAFVLTMARNMAVDHNVPVAFFSLEMSSLLLAKRLMISETGLEPDKIKGGKRLEDYEWEQLNAKLNKLVKAPLYIDDTPSLSIYEFRSKARRLVSNAGVKMIVIDYLQLMTGPPEFKGMREQEVSAISRSLKAIAKELNIPIIALSQLSRAVETRGGTKRPQLSDLRESGAIEQDADIVMFIHRPDYYSSAEENPELIGLTDIIIAKHRNGEVRDVQMRFRHSEVKFVDTNDVKLDTEMFSNERIETFSSKMNKEEFISNSDFDINF